MDFFNKRKEIDEAYRRLFNTPDGRVVLADMLARCRIDVSCFDPDPYKTSYFNAKRDFGLELMQILHTNTVKFTDEIKETMYGS